MSHVGAQVLCCLFKRLVALPVWGKETKRWAVITLCHAGQPALRVNRWKGT